MKALLWDLDGTLVDSREDLAASVNAMLRGLGRPELPLETVMGFVGHGARMLIRRALGGLGDETAALEAFLAHYRQHLLDRTRPYAGIPELLAELGGRGLPMAVLTNKPGEHARAILSGLGLAAHFREVLGGDECPRPKPDPAGALMLLERLGVRPGEAALIGDSDTDVLTARAAGMRSLGVAWGIAPDSLVRVPPDRLIQEARELLTEG